MSRVSGAMTRGVRFTTPVGYAAAVQPLLCLAMVLTLLPLPSNAQNLSVSIKLVTAQGEGESIGGVRIEQTRFGLVFRPALTGLTPGLRGMHIHEMPSCAPAPKDGVMTAAEAAGGHLGTNARQKHGEPWGDGHLGDLPPLYVDGDGNAKQPVARAAAENQ